MGVGHRTVELTGAPRSLAFPQACANCGAATGRRLRVEKVFRREGGLQPARDVVARVNVPFCATCIEQHKSEAVTLPAGQRFLSAFRSALLIPAFGFAFAALALVPRLTDRLGARHWQSATAVLGLVLLFAVLGIVSARAALRQTRRVRVTAPTTVTAAFDFGDDLSTMFEPQRRRYELANRRFADAFVAANAGRVWESVSGRARAADRGRTAVLLVTFGCVAVALGWLAVSALRG